MPGAAIDPYLSVLRQEDNIKNIKNTAMVILNGTLVIEIVYNIVLNQVMLWQLFD